MKFLAVAALLAGAVIAAPTSNTGGGLLCPSGLFSNPQCCASYLYDDFGLDCEVPGDGDFRKVCRNKGKEAACCVIPVAGQALLCKQAASN